MNNGVGGLIGLELDSEQITSVLSDLAPSTSTLVIGLHGIGKSQITRQLPAAYKQKMPQYEWPLFDVRLSLYTEGDIVGIPDQDKIAQRRVTCFLPVDWVARACDQPAIIFLDEINRAETQIQNSAFQLILERELNGNKLHPETRIIAACNPPTHYNVTDLDPALVDRFLVLRLKLDVERWLGWARTRLDDALVDFIMEQPRHLMVEDVGSLAQLEVAPTPRSWEKLDTQLRFSGMTPTDVSGKQVPANFAVFCHGFVGTEAGNAFVKFVQDRKRFLSVEDVLDHWNDPKKGPGVRQLAKILRHEENLAVIDRIAAFADHTLKPHQFKNIADWAVAHLSGEDVVLLFTSISGKGDEGNITGLHATALTQIIVESVNAQQKMEKAREARQKADEDLQKSPGR